MLAKLVNERSAERLVSSKASAFDDRDWGLMRNDSLEDLSVDYVGSVPEMASMRRSDAVGTHGEVMPRFAEGGCIAARQSVTASTVAG
jgi:hypothetical protein